LEVAAGRRIAHQRSEHALMPNIPAAGKTGIAPLFAVVHHRPGLPEQGRYAKSRMNRITAMFLLILTGLLVGCATPDVKYSDLKPTTTASVSGDTITVHLGSDVMNSACYSRPKARVEGRTVYICAYRTLREQSREFVVRLPTASSSPAVSVVWVDPDGSRAAVPITK
jgi:hypothetical protein